MALVKYGAGIVQISGSIAGDVHARNRFGNYIRPRTKPVNPRSIRQEAIRSILSHLAEYWHGTLTPLQRAAWEVYAAAVAMKNRLGETIYLTGYNHFIRTNGSHVTWSGIVLPNAPVILNMPEQDDALVCVEEGIAGQSFNFECNTDGWAPNGDPKMIILLYQGIPQLASRNFFDGPWRYMGVINATEGALGSATKDASFVFGLGQKVWFQARLMTNSGRLTNLWTLPPRVIIADV